jgi:hypothetical protein
LHTKYALAEVLHKSLDELEQMTTEEFLGWMAYFQIKEEKRKEKQNGK